MLSVKKCSGFIIRILPRRPLPSVWIWIIPLWNKYNMWYEPNCRLNFILIFWGAIRRPILLLGCPAFSTGSSVTSPPPGSYWTRVSCRWRTGSTGTTWSRVPCAGTLTTSFPCTRSGQQVGNKNLQDRQVKNRYLIYEIGIFKNYSYLFWHTCTGTVQILSPIRIGRLWKGTWVRINDMDI